MQTFKLVTTSRIHYVLFMLVGIFGSAFVLFGLILKTSNQYVVIGAIIGISIFVYWLAEKYSKQIVELSISEEYLRIDWVRLPLFSNKQNKELAWREIDTYVYQTEKDFDLFKLTLKDGEKLKFSIAHDLDHQNSFHKFYIAFLGKVEGLQEQQVSGKEVTIKQGKTFYETPVGIGLAFLLAGAIVLAFIIAFLNQDKRPVKWGKLIAGSFTCLFYIQLVWTHNKKKKSKA